MTPGKGEYSIFESVNGDADVRAMLVPVPTKNFAGVYIFKSWEVHDKTFQLGLRCGLCSARGSSMQYVVAGNFAVAVVLCNWECVCV